MIPLSHFNSLQFVEGFSRKYRRVKEQSSRIKYRLRSGRNTLVAAPVTLFHNAVAAGELLPDIEDVEERRLRIVDGPIVAEIVPVFESYIFVMFKCACPRCELF